MSLPTPEDLLPHRDPFLLLDTILELEEDRIVAQRLVRADEYYFAGHYPDYPVMPGVLQCEAVLQAAAALIANLMQRSKEDMQGKVPVVARIQDAKFRKQVRPGDLLIIESTLQEKIANAYLLRGTVKVGDAVVLRMNCTVTTADAQKGETA